MRNTLAYRIMLWVLLIASLLLLARMAPVLTDPKYIPIDDFVRYWAGGKLNLAGENPYDPQQIARLQTDAGGQASETDAISIMLNPPWAMVVVMPLGLLSYPVSRLVWLLLCIALLILCAQQLWHLYQGSPKSRWLAWVVAFIFAPTISVLEKGQITPLLLLGIVGFLYFAEARRNDWAAGAMLALVSIKPQVSYLLWIALLFWVIQERRWLILVSGALTVTLLTLIAMAFNPHVIQQYLAAMQTYQTSEWATPAIGSYLRYFWLGTDKFWPQFIPAIFGVVWFLVYWYHHHKTWQWLNTIPLILLVSVVTTPYAWTYDQVILIPAIIQATIWMVQEWKRWSILLLAGLFIGLNLLDLVLHMKLNDFWFVWLAPGLLIWYLLTSLTFHRPELNPVKS